MSDNQPTMMDSRLAVDALTKPWTDVLTPKETGSRKYVPVDYRPLLDMLRDAIGSSLGQTQPGRSALNSRSVLNLDAFTLWEHIDGMVRAWLKELSIVRPESELKAALIQLAGLLDALHASNQIPESKWLNITAQFPKWRKQIWELFDPPIVKELIGSCPSCTAKVFTGADGGRVAALQAYYLKNVQPEAKCLCCGERWSGERALLELGFSLGANMDEVALKEMGVI